MTTPQPRRVVYSGPVLRGYRYTCVCGLHVSGVYPLTRAEMIATHNDRLRYSRRANVPLDPKRARCEMVKTLPANNRGVVSNVSPPPHTVGCGRTLAESDAEREKQRAGRQEVAA